MTIPPEIRYASGQFMELLGALKSKAFLVTHNQCYAMLRGVLHELRKYMTVEQALAFADILPPVVRAIFVEHLRPDRPLPPLPAKDVFLEDVKKALSPHHVPPDSIVGDVFFVLEDAIGKDRIATTLGRLSPALYTFWRDNAG